jgi:hypothetical protein
VCPDVAESEIFPRAFSASSPETRARCGRMSQGVLPCRHGLFHVLSRKALYTLRRVTKRSPSCFEMTIRMVRYRSSSSLCCQII